MIRDGLFVTATGTGVGKTWVTRGLARAAVRRGLSCAALKPIETGSDPEPLDALALARACGRPDLARASGLYRARLPLAPYAAVLEGAPPLPALDALAQRCWELGGDADTLIVEGAGGLLVPLDATHTMADFARALGLPLVLVANDALGVLSHVLAASESARARSLGIVAIVLTRRADVGDDPSVRTNAQILRERLSVPVAVFPSCRDDDDALADAVEASGLAALCTRTQT